MPLTTRQLNQMLAVVRDVDVHSASTNRHSVIIPIATYSPWNEDKDFLSVFETIKDNTLVDIYRCFELWSLSNQVAHLPGDFLEVGVWRGGTGCLLAHRLAHLNSRQRVYLCDTFSGVVKAGAMDSTYRGGEHADTSVSIVEDLADGLDIHNYEILQGVFPEQTGDKIADHKFSLCHIDVDVYESARDVLDWVWPRLLVGGVVIYDDYGFPACDGVTRLVNERMETKGALTLHNLNGHAVVIKIASDLGGNTP